MDDLWYDDRKCSVYLPYEPPEPDVVPLHKILKEYLDEEREALYIDSKIKNKKTILWLPKFDTPDSVHDYDVEEVDSVEEVSCEEGADSNVEVVSDQDEATGTDSIVDLPGVDFNSSKFMYT